MDKYFSKPSFACFKKLSFHAVEIHWLGGELRLIKVNMAKQKKTLGEALKNELVKVFWGIVAAAFVFLIFWFIAMPLLKKQIQNVGGKSAPSSQNNHGNQSAK